jgi:hypothetical protein
MKFNKRTPLTEHCGNAVDNLKNLLETHKGIRSDCQLFIKNDIWTPWATSAFSGKKKQTQH